MERLIYYSEVLVSNSKSEYISDLEGEVNRFTRSLTPGAREEKLLEYEEGNLRIYHAGLEVKNRIGLYGDRNYTGRELVFLEFKDNEELYHLTGGVDVEDKTFDLVSVTKYRKGSLRKVFRKRSIVEKVTGILKNIRETSDEIDTTLV